MDRLSRLLLIPAGIFTAAGLGIGQMTNVLPQYWPQAPHWVYAFLFWSGAALTTIPLPSWLVWLGWKNRTSITQRHTMIFGIVLVVVGCAIGVVGLSIISFGENQKPRVTTPVTKEEKPIILRPTNEQLRAKREVLKEQIPYLKRELETLDKLMNLREVMYREIFLRAAWASGILLYGNDFGKTSELPPNYRENAKNVHTEFVRLRGEIEEYTRSYVIKDQLGAVRGQTLNAIWRLESRIRLFDSNPRWMELTPDRPAAKKDLEERIDAYWLAVVTHSKAAHLIYDDYDRRLAEINQEILYGPSQK
jgi:hypothetical protein